MVQRNYPSEPNIHSFPTIQQFYKPYFHKHQLSFYDLVQVDIHSDFKVQQHRLLIRFNIVDLNRERCLLIFLLLAEHCSLL